MKRKNDPRHLARIVAMQKLFSKHFADSKDENQVNENLSLGQIAELAEVGEFDLDLAQKILDGVDVSIPQINTIISDYAPQWPLDQIQKVDIEILRIAIWEGFIGKLTPPKVAIDEAIEIGKEFGGEASGKFINGVLGAIFEKLKQENPNDNNK